MDQLLKRKAQIRSYLEDKLGFPNRHFPNLKDYIIVDEEQVHFIHLLMGWKKDQYIYQALRHIEIKADGGLIIHQANIDKPLDTELINLGISASNIQYHEADRAAIE
ncbi:MAG: element excision factor XisI family protein [Bacteroidota bacterium]